MHGKLSNAVTKFTEIHFHISKKRLDMQQYKEIPSGVHPVAVNREDGECAFYNSRRPRRQQSQCCNPKSPACFKITLKDYVLELPKELMSHHNFRKEERPSICRCSLHLHHFVIETPCEGFKKQGCSVCLPQDHQVRTFCCCADCNKDEPILFCSSRCFSAAVNFR